MVDVLPLHVPDHMPNHINLRSTTNDQYASFVPILMEVSPSGSESGQDLARNQSVIDHAKETLLKMIQDDQSGRGMRPKSRSFSSDVNEGKTRRESRFSMESNYHSPQNRRGHLPHLKLESRSRGPVVAQSDDWEVGGSLSPESKDFLKAVTTTGHREKDPLPQKVLQDVFGPALPPNLVVQSSTRRRTVSRRSSSSSQKGLRSESSSSSNSSSCSKERKKSKERSTRRREVQRKSLKNKKQKRSRSRDKSIQRKKDSSKACGRSNLKSGTPKSERNSSSRKILAFADVNRKRKRQDECSSDGSPDSKKHRVTPALEKSRKRVQEKNKDSERRFSRSISSGRKKSVESVKRNSNVHEYLSKTALTNYSSSSSSCSSSSLGSDRERRSAVTKQKVNAKQNTKEVTPEKAAAAAGETLQDLEQFLQELKAKKKAISK